MIKQSGSPTQAGRFGSRQSSACRVGRRRQSHAHRRRHRVILIPDDVAAALLLIAGAAGIRRSFANPEFTAAAHGKNSVVKTRACACAGIGSGIGSGIVVDNHAVVASAWTVAGAVSTAVSDSPGHVIPATVTGLDKGSGAALPELAMRARHPHLRSTRPRLGLLAESPASDDGFIPVTG